jgi:hypothetical protein
MQNPGASGNTESLAAAFSENRTTRNRIVVSRWLIFAVLLKSFSFDFCTEDSEATSREGRCKMQTEFPTALSAFETLKTVSFLSDKHPHTGHSGLRKQAFFSLSFLRSLLRC